MRALVVFESMFGNTEVIARAIAEGLAANASVEVVEVGAAPASLPADLDLLVVGGPTHAHGMSKPESRADSARRAGDRLVSRGSGIREWLESLQGGSATVAAAAFDTRIKGPGILWGSAAKSADKLLRGLGLRVAARARELPRRWADRTALRPPGRRRDGSRPPVGRGARAQGPRPGADRTLTRPARAAQALRGARGRRSARRRPARRRPAATRCRAACAGPPA